MRPIVPAPAILALLTLSLVLATPSGAAPPTVPASLPYQGLLLDGLGQPRSGSVDLTIRIFDAVVGGTLVYKQSFPGVALADGVFSVQLGPAGVGTDTPANPLTTSLATALAGDAGATAPVRFLEITVGGDGALSRSQILSSAFALRATSAASADSAASATEVGGFSSEWITQLLTHGLADNGQPPNTDPREGLADTDGDGLANFVDSDNDNDGIVDSTEIAQGTDINLVTPKLTQVTPNSGFDTATTLITVTGTNFQPDLSFSIGTQTPAVSNLTATQFEASVGPQPAGPVDAIVTLANGQSRTLANAFTFTVEPPPPPPPPIPAVPHDVSLGSPTAGVPAIDLAVKPGTTEVLLGGHKHYGVGDATTSLTVHPLATRGASGQIAIAYDAANRVSGLRCRDLAPTCVVEVLTDTDADGELEDETGTAIETLNGSAMLHAAQLERDPTAGWVASYVRRNFSAEIVVAHDRNGDGDFTDASEFVVVEPAGASFAATKSVLAVDAGGRVAYAYFVSGVGVRLAWDRNGDGDFADTVTGNPELVTLAGAGLNCFDIAFDSAGHLALAYENAGQRLFRDINDDGDFGDAGEELLLGTTSSGCPEIADAGGGRLAVAFGTALWVDLDGDGEFADADEQSSLALALGNSGDLRSNGSDRVIAVGAQGAYAGGSLFVRDTTP